MTGELIVLAVAVAGGGLLYFHYSGKAFDRKYQKPVEPAAPHEQRATGRQ